MWEGASQKIQNDFYVSGASQRVQNHFITDVCGVAKDTKSLHRIHLWELFHVNI